MTNQTFTAYMHFRNKDGEGEQMILSAAGKMHFPTLAAARAGAIAGAMEEGAMFARDGAPFKKCEIRIYSSRLVETFDAVKTKPWRNLAGYAGPGAQSTRR